MLRAYVRDCKAGKLDPRPGWRVEPESPGTAVIDAGRRLGIIVGPKAMRLAIEKVRTVGVGVVTVYNSGRFGAIGHFAMRAAPVPGPALLEDPCPRNRARSGG